MPTVAIDCRYITDKPSGIGSYVRGLLEWLPSLAPDLTFLLLRSHKAPGALCDAPNVRERVVPYESSGPATMWALPRLVDLRGVDLFHATFNLEPAGLTMPVVTTIHDTMWLEHAELCKRPGPWGYVETAYWRHGMRRALRRSARLLTVSEASKRAIAALSADAGARTRVTPLGVEPWLRPMNDDEDDRAALRTLREGKLRGVGRYVLSVGQFAGYKNHEGVVRAFARAFGPRDDVDLVMVHRLGSSSRLVPLMRALGVEARVRFLHGLSEAEIRALFWGATALCHPSLIEGFGLPVAEAMACGCPVITSDASAMPEVAGGAAALVDPRDDASIAQALLKVVDDEDLRAEMMARGLRRASELSREVTAGKTLAVYREVLSP
jgi:glycosyltransferase involved in cell wall biosynthesis